MRHSVRIGSLLGVISSTVIASPILPITVGPIVVAAEATTRPSTTVLLTPFRSIGEPGQSAWIGDAVDESVSNDLAKDRSLRVIKPPATTRPADGSIDGLKIARDAHADRLVTGSYQMVDDQVRFTGEVVDPCNGQVVGHLNIAGPKHELFRLEDELAAQIAQVIPNAGEPDRSFTVTPVASNGLAQQTAPPTPPATDAGAGVVFNPPASIYDSGVVYSGYPEQPYSNFGYYGYPYLDSPLFIYINGGRYHHGGRDRGGYVGGGFNDGSRYFGGRDIQTGGGQIEPLRTAPVRTAPTFPNGRVRNPGPASLTPSHGFVGPNPPAVAAEPGNGNGRTGGSGGGGAGGGGAGAGRR